MILKLFLLLKKVPKYFFSPLKIFLFKKIGISTNLNVLDHYDFKNISIGNNVYISNGAHWSCPNSYIIVGDDVQIGPNSTIITGDHIFNVEGFTIIESDILFKENKRDEPVILEGDNWIGCNVTILKGVVIGQGSVIAANSLVNKSVLPYSVYAGCPAKKIKDRF